MDTRVVYLEPGKINLAEQTLPGLAPNQVLVRTHQASVCGSERYFYRGISVRPEDEARGGTDAVLGEHGEGSYEYPMGPLGHEGGGTIVEKGSAVDEYLGGGKVAVGDRVGSLIYPTYTDHWVTDIAHVQPIPEGVSFEVGCLYEPLGCAVWAALGMGVRLGDVVPAKLELAKQVGADCVLNPNEVDLREAIDELTDGEGVDVAAEAVGGRGEGLKQALDMVRHNGIMALYGDNYAPVREFCFHRFHEDGLEIRNLNAVHYTRLRSIEHMREAYRVVQRGVFDLDAIFENSVRYRLAELPEVFARENGALGDQGSMKTLVVP